MRANLVIYIKHTDHKSGTMIQIMVQNRDTNSSATQNKDKKIMVQYKHKDTNLEHMNINQLRFSISFSCSLSVKSSLPLFVFREQKNSLKSWSRIREEAVCMREVPHSMKTSSMPLAQQRSRHKHHLMYYFMPIMYWQGTTVVSGCQVCRTPYMEHKSEKPCMGAQSACD